MQKRKQYKKWLMLASFVWVLLICVSFVWNSEQIWEYTLKIVEHEANMAFNKDIAYRLWNASHRGVYVPVTKDTQPNPYLKVDSRDVITTSGKKLTLINPAYMTRQVFNLSEKLYGIKGHITSLKPINPNNTPDEWERKALLKIANDKTARIKELVSINGKYYLRFMKQLIIKKPCLKCHKIQGYKLGDIRGGIGYKVPMDGPIYEAKQSILSLGIAHASFLIFGILMLMFSYKKITKYLLATVELQERTEKDREKLAVTLYSIGDGVIATDKDKKVKFLNRVAEKLTGWRTDEAKGKKVEEIFNIIDETTREPVKDPVTEALKKEKIVKLVNNAILLSKDGKEYYIEDSVAPIRDKDSNIIGIVVVFRDETEKIKLRNEIIKSEKLKSVATLAAGIAHDFNNILTGIYGNLDLVRLKIGDNPTVAKNIELMNKSIDRAKKLTGQLLTYTKGGAPITKLIDIKDVIKDTVEFNISGSELVAHFEFEENLWKTDVDKEQISEAISNIVINAKHSMKNEGNLYITVKNLSEESARKEIGKLAKFVKIMIKDEGEGIPENIISEIFDPFFTTKEKGTGLGLATTHAIIERHHGIILVSSEVGKGSVFSIYLPAKEEIPSFRQPTKKDNNNKDNNKSLVNKKILVMDDEEMIRDITRDLFENLGAVVETCKNGEEAIEKYRKDKFDVVIMDLTIRGGMGGKETVKEILKIDKNAKVIVSSGYFNDPVIADYKSYGFKGKLFKPVRMEEAVEEIIRVLNLT